MADRGEVIKGLNDIHAVACGLDNDQCFLNGISVWQLQTLIDAATELLKGQEPRVMSLDELHERVTYWVEDETGHVVPETIMDITGKDIMTIPVVHLANGYAPIITKTTDGYNSKRFTGWRCWSSRPTDAQREAVKWDG